MGSTRDSMLIFSESDFIVNATNTDSRFDALLKTKWSEALDRDVFRYKVTKNSLTTKVIPPANYKFIAQLNEGRGELRRKPHEMSSLRMPFDNQRFNFTKIKPEEVLFKIKWNNTDEEATVIINSSPIEYCNALLVPHLSECRPQVLTGDSLRLAISVLALSGQRSLRLGFNSLGAMASVNHQHWHLYYYDFDLKIETLPIRDFILTDWPIHGIVFELRELTKKSIDTIVKRVTDIVNYCLNDAQLAHNLFLTRTPSGCIRIFLWTREPLFGTKNDAEICPAFCEYTGFFICKNRQMFDTIGEQTCVDLLSSVNTRIDKIKHLLN